MIDGQEGRVLAAVQWRGVAGAGLEFEVEHGTGVWVPGGESEGANIYLFLLTVFSANFFFQIWRKPTGFYCCREFKSCQITS